VRSPPPPHPPHPYSAIYISLLFVCTFHPTMLPCSHHEMSLTNWRAHGLRQPDPTFHPLAIPRECGTTIGRYHIIAHGAVFLATFSVSMTHVQQSHIEPRTFPAAIHAACRVVPRHVHTQMRAHTHTHMHTQTRAHSFLV